MKNLTKKDFATNWSDLIRKIQTEATPFQDDTPEKKRERIERGRVDDKYFAETYFPHYVAEDSFPTYTDELFDAGDRIGKDPGPFSIVAGYNESAKSTFLSHIQPIKFIVYKLRWFMLFVSKTDQHAAQFVKAIKIELDHNERLRHDFGDLSTADDWAEDDLTTNTGRRVKGIGRDQSPKGLNVMGHRIDHFVADDMEEDRTTMNPRQMKKYFKWIQFSLIPSTNSKRWSGVYIFNYTSKKLIGHLLMTAPHTSSYHKLIVRALDDNDESTWPSRHPTSGLLKLREENPVTFEPIYMQHPREEDEGLIKEGWIRYFTEEEIPPAPPACAAYDPSTGKKTDFQAIVIEVADPQQPKQRFIPEAHVNHDSKWQCLRRLYQLDKTYHFMRVFIEANAFQETISEDLEELEKEFKYLLPFTMITHSYSKEVRFVRYAPRVERGRVKFAQGAGVGRVVDQMLNYDGGTYPDDGFDAAEMVDTEMTKLLGGGYKPEYKTVTRRAIFQKDDDDDVNEKKYDQEFKIGERR